MIFSDEEEQENRSKVEFITSISKDDKVEKDKKKEALVIPLKKEQDSVHAVVKDDKLQTTVKPTDKKPVIWGLEVPKGNTTQKGKSNDLPLLLQNKLFVGLDGKEDLKARPAEPTLTDYEKVPVSEFGAAMLRGMGWRGPDTTDDSTTKPIIKYVPRPERLGLGASQVKNESELSRRKPIEESLGIELNPDEERLVKQFDPRRKTNNKNTKPQFGGKHANYVGIDDNESSSKRAKNYLQVGSPVFIDSGEHSGLFGTIVKEQTDFWFIRLSVNDEILSVSKDFVKLTSDTSMIKQKQSSEHSHNNASETNESWACPGLLVRIKSKNSFKNGRYYNRKGSIVDVQSDSSCTIRVSPSELLHGVPQSVLETCLPRKPDPARASVKYLKSDHHGKEYFQAPFRVLQFDDEAGKAVIQADDELEVIFEADYNDICEFIKND